MPLPIIYHPNYVVPLPDGHRFPMEKFRRVYDVLLRDGIATVAQVHTPRVAVSEMLQTVHAPDYVRAYLEGDLDDRAMRRIGLPWSAPLVIRTCTAVGGTIHTAEMALQYGLACNTAGGTHHAFPEYGSGFCIFNDLAVASQVLLDAGKVKQILIVDLDVHQGDGTAFIFRDAPRVFTFSMHCGANYPFTKQQGDLDVSLPEGMDDDAYLRTLDVYLPDLLGKVKPDLVLYDAGVDPHESDRLGKLALTDSGIFQRDRMVLEMCVSRRIPVAGVVGGGYSDNIDDLAHRHSLLHRAAGQLYEQYGL